MRRHEPSQLVEALCVLVDCHDRMTETVGAQTLSNTKSGKEIRCASRPSRVEQVEGWVCRELVSKANPSRPCASVTVSLPRNRQCTWARLHRPALPESSASRAPVQVNGRKSWGGRLIHGSAEPPAARDVAFVAAQNDGVDEADHAEISYWMRPQRASRAISAGRVQLESYQKL